MVGLAPIMNLALAAPGRSKGAGVPLQHAVVEFERSMSTGQPLGDPLSSEEVLALLRSRWQASYDLQLVHRRGRLYLQVMWAYLEQQSFPLSEADYLERIETLVGNLNGLGVAQQVREWLTSTRDRPRLGRAMTLALVLPEGRSSEFLL